MRIVGGEFGGRRLATPKSQRIRPTSDRTRESLFNILSSRMSFEGLRVIDLFAGTGALGLEAASRGAGFALFVEESAEGRALLRENIEVLGLQGRARIYRRDATSLGEPGTLKPFDLAFLDPPYGKGLGERAIASLLAGGWLNPGAEIVIEERKDALPATLPMLDAVDRRAFGDTEIAIFVYDEKKGLKARPFGESG